VPIDTLVGTTLAGYALRGKVGEGGTATVFRAEHPAHGTVALKVLKDKLQDDPTAVARFLREARYGSRVIHPNIVRTLDYGQAPEGGRHYLAIEWANGELLEKHAERRGPLEPSEVVLVVSQIGEAVAAAHLAGIVHRDLKPENVMYDAEQRHVKLLDFGIAVDTDAPADQRLTRAGFFVGSLMYVAPEALSGELVGPAADQYSLATIAFFLLTGVLPYPGKTPRELFTQLLTQPPTPLNSAKAGKRFAPAVEAVLTRALARQPADRYPSVAAFTEAFAAAVAGGGASAPSPGGTGSSGGFLGKMKGLFGR
jgi:serine/threonine-protein kinase